VNVTDDADDSACDTKHCSPREAAVAANCDPDDGTSRYAHGNDLQSRRGSPFACDVVEECCLSPACTVVEGSTARS
jgi:hypothetical protein